ncbi:MAG: potassium transporter KtrB, partial [Clostridia bacterium]|nr:potassium transporter KtrB [Clostridia bacterium]
MQKKLKRLSPIQTIMFAFLSVILLGSILLSLPISSADGMAVPYIDALFTATTSACVTGLVTLPVVTTWSFFGQLVILLLIQIGGLGVITVVAGFLMLMNRKFGLDDRILIGESFNLNS